ncbi:MAG: hypothetical protein KF709_11935 [Gemmatimonadaceae bacterium]|nr:hypothetical protein [Gemmatimonadaceae bacterium]
MGTNSASVRAAQFATPARGAWARAALALVLAVGVIWWPYPASCGLLLGSYAAVVLSVTVVGAWTSWLAWRAQVPTAHVIGLGVSYWGIVLAAELVLPRIGYASVEAGWRCVG